MLGYAKATVTQKQKVLQLYVLIPATVE
jgi:hypothetical protein